MNQKNQAQIEEESDIFHQNQQAIKQQQDFINIQNQSIKDMNKQFEVSCWSETQRSIESQQVEGEQKESKRSLQKNRQDGNEELQIEQLLNLDRINAQSIKQNQFQENLNSCVQNQQSQTISRQSISSLIANRLKKNSFSAYVSQNIRRETLQEERTSQHTQINRIQLNQRLSKNDESKIQNSISSQNMFRIRRKIVYFIKSFTFSGRSKQISNQIKSYINDKSDCINELNPVLICLYNLIPIQQILNLVKVLNVGLIDSQGNISIALSFFFIVLNGFFQLALSIFVVFGGFTSFIDRVFLFVFIMWVIEFLIKINRTLTKDSKLITQRYKIITNYFKEKLLFDFIPMFAIILNYDHNLIRSLAFLKLVNLISDLKDFQQYLIISIRKYYIVILLNLILKIFTLAHIISCLWYILSRIETLYLNSTSWVDETLDNADDWWKLYSQAMYWALTLMTTGSNAGTTNTEVIFTSFIMIFTTIGFGYLLSVVGFILETIEKQNEQKRSDINVINEYMRQKQISKQFHFQLCLFVFES